jgi:hypothetical protein
VCSQAFFLNGFDTIFVFYVLEMHLLKFALFSLDSHPIVRATRVFIFLVRLGITRRRYTTRR